MKFKDSFFYSGIVKPIKAWATLSPYYMALGLPMMAVLLALTALFVIPIDGYCACKEVWRVTK